MLVHPDTFRADREAIPPRVLAFMRGDVITANILGITHSPKK